MGGKYIQSTRDRPARAENEILISARVGIRQYLEQANTIFQSGKAAILKGSGNAMGNAIRVSEMLRNGVAGLHAINRFYAQEIETHFEPREQGLDPIDQKRRVPSVEISLSLNQLDANDVGYQAPVSAENVVPLTFN